MPYDTLESAQARIVELNATVTELENERDTLSQNNKSLTEENENLRTLNQNYFNRLVAQNDRETDKEEEEPEIVSCEEFAKSITEKFRR